MSRSVEEIVSELMERMEEEFGWRFSKEEYRNTPIRIYKMYHEWYKNNTYAKMTAFDPVNKFDSLISLSGIDYGALCSHHLMPFFGKISIVYLPKDKILGASKLARYVNKYAYKPTTQETMTESIAKAVLEETEARGVMVYSVGVHTCITMRGVNKSESTFKISTILGEFKDKESLKEEAFELARIEI